MSRARSLSHCAHLVAAAGGALCIATAALGDEDWRKLADRQPPVQGPILGGEGLRGVFASSGVNLMSWIPLNQFPNGAGQASAADIWGYVSPSGREYAIIGLEDGTAFVEVTNPATPAVVGYVAGPQSLWHDATVIGNHAYLASEGGSGIQVVSMANIDAGQVQHLGNVMQAGHTTTHTIVSNTASGFLYLCGTNINNGGLTAVSTANPASPSIAGAWTTRYVHEAEVVTYTSGPYAGREIAFCFTGGPAHGATPSGGFDIVDVTNKSNMFTMAELRYPGVRFCHQGWPTADRRYLYINDELDEPGTVSTTTTHIIDIQNLSNPVWVRSFTNGLPSIDHNLYVKNNLVFASNYRSGLRIYAPVALPGGGVDPTTLFEAGWIDTYGANDNPNFNGNWGNYPFFPSGTVVLSDLESGLIVVQPALNTIGLTFPSGRPATVPSRRPAEVFVQTTVIGTTVNAGSAVLTARINGGAWEARPMVALGGGLFRGTLPPAPCFATIEYSVGVSSAEGAAFRSPADTGENYTAQVLTGTSTIVSHTFETAQGWTVGDPSSPDTATTGVWERADPQGTTAQPGDDHTPAPGVMCWVTGAQAGGGAGDFDVDNGKTTLMSPVFNLAANPEARIGYWRWYSNSQGGAPNADTFVVSVSPDAGTNWAVAETVGPSGPGTNGGWNFHEFRVADILAPTATMKVRFVASDLGTGSLIEALVDDFAITSPVCSASCVTDRDNNLVVNSSDISVYLTAWLADVTAGTFTADFDGLGGTNSTDISAFLTAWLGEVTGGCN